MRVRVFSLLLALLTIPTFAFADAHKADFYGGGSGGTGGSIIGGFIAGVNWGTKCPWFDVVGPVASNQGGGHDEKALSQTVFHGGGRFTLTSMRKDREGHYLDKRYKPFGQILVGGVITNINDGSGDAIKDFSYTFGGGIDTFLHKPKQLHGREHSAGVGIRVQVDYVVRPGDHTNFTRVSAGVIYRILKEN